MDFADTPITTKQSDRLGFSRIAQSLTDAITAQPNSTSFTLGLDGAWGSGKSSILSLLLNELETRDFDGSIGTVVVQFSPWLITNRAALAASFFRQLSSALEQAEDKVPDSTYYRKSKAKKLLKEARGRLNTFSEFISLTATASSVVDPTLISAIIGSGAKWLGGITSRKSDDSLEQTKTLLHRQLSEVATIDESFRILVLVDDLDRLDPSDVLEVLRLVKAVGDLPAITYLLAYDRKAVANSISHAAKIDDGDLYLEKIIQFSFSVPPLEPFQLRHWLRSELDKSFEGQYDGSTERASTVLDIWAGKLLRTPRDLKRLIFAVRAVWPQLQGKVDLLDLIWLQLVSQKASSGNADLYAWIVAYLQSLDAIAVGGVVSAKESTQRQLYDILSKLGWVTYSNNSSTSSIEFHNLDQLLAGVEFDHLEQDQGGETITIFQADSEELQDYRDEKRLSSPWHWRLYFALDTPSHALTDAEWQVLVEAAKNSKDELTQKIKDILALRVLDSTNTSDQIIQRAMHLASNDCLDNVEHWILSSVESIPLLLRHSRSQFGFGRLVTSELKTFVEIGFKQLEGSTRSITIDEIFNSANNLSIAAELIREQYLVVSGGDTNKADRLFLTDKEIDVCKATQLSLYQSLTPEQLQNLQSPYAVLYAWRDLGGDSSSPNQLLDEAFSTDGGLIATLESLRYVSSSAQNGVPHIPEGFLDNFTDAQSLKSRLTQLSKAEGPLASKASTLLSLWWERGQL